MSEKGTKPDIGPRRVDVGEVPEADIGCPRPLPQAIDCRKAGTGLWFAFPDAHRQLSRLAGLDRLKARLPEQVRNPHTYRLHLVVKFSFDCVLRIVG